MNNIQAVTEMLQRAKGFYEQLKPYVIKRIPKDYNDKLIYDELMGLPYNSDEMQWGDENYVEYLQDKIERYNKAVAYDYDEGLDCFESMDRNAPLTLDGHKPLIDLTHALSKLVFTLEELICIYETRESGNWPSDECDCDDCKSKGGN